MKVDLLPPARTITSSSAPVPDPRTPRAGGAGADWTAWRRHFERNAARPLPAVPGAPTGLTRRQVDALGLTLAKFRLGETGEGRIARQIDDFRHEAIDDDYRVALKLFVREEGRHAHVLGRCVRALDGPRLRATWSERLFRRGRHLAGVRLKLLVLLAAEVIAIGFYGGFVEQLPAGPLRDALAQIVDDEEAHLAFHADFFRSQAATALQRAAFHAAWWPTATAACLVVLVDHRSTLRAFDLRLRHTTTRLLATIHIATP